MQRARHEHRRHAGGVQRSEISRVAHATGGDHGDVRALRAQAVYQCQFRSSLRTDTGQFHRDHPRRPESRRVCPVGAERHAAAIVERQQRRHARRRQFRQCVWLGQALAAQHGRRAGCTVQRQRGIGIGETTVHPELDLRVTCSQAGDHRRVIAAQPADGVEVGDIYMAGSRRRDQRIDHVGWRAALDQARAQRLVSLPVATARVHDPTLHQVDHGYQFRHRKPYMNQRIFVFEFITGGGLAGQPLPGSLAREGRLMRDALLRDAADITGAELVTLHDARLEAPLPDSIAVANEAGAFDTAFDAALAAADAALIVAPETGDLLATLAARVEASGSRLLGCDAASCRVATSKSRTARVLAEAGVAVLPHYSDADALPDILGAWAVKPDDGAGCDGLQRLVDRATAARALRAAGPDHIAQPWLDGEARSMNLLCARGRAALLSVNRQVLEHGGERVRLAALAVGAVDATPQHAALAQRIAAAVPGLLGPVGVDFIETEDGPVVVEINPRMSTSACALRAATGLNLVAATLSAARDGTLPSTDAPRPHTLTLEAHDETV